MMCDFFKTAVLYLNITFDLEGLVTKSKVLLVEKKLLVRIFFLMDGYGQEGPKLSVIFMSRVLYHFKEVIKLNIAHKYTTDIW